MFCRYSVYEKPESYEKKIKLEKLIVEDREYLMITAMYSPILFIWENVSYFKIYGERKYIAKKEDGSVISWDDDLQHNEILENYSEAKNNRFFKS